MHFMFPKNRDLTNYPNQQKIISIFASNLLDRVSLVRSNLLAYTYMLVMDQYMHVQLHM